MEKIFGVLTPSFVAIVSCSKKYKNMKSFETVWQTIKSDSVGDKAGLRSGYIIKSIDGIDIGKITDLKHIKDITVQDIEKLKAVDPKILTPPYNERNRKRDITNAILNKIYGPPDTLVSTEYIDEKGDSYLKEIVRAKRKGKMQFDDALPPFFVKFESKLLENNIRYVWFNAFMPPVKKKFKETIKSMQDKKALIIDIRGNHGGFFDVRKAMAEALVNDRVLFWRFQGRDRTREVYLEPADSVYAGPVVVIVDCLSISSAEEFSGGLQAIKRATIVGERTPGVVVTGNVEKLPNGATFVYPKARTITADGTVLEGHGVIPDIESTIDRNELLRGKDSQLEAAVNFIKN